jgi:hypothetical protein
MPHTQSRYQMDLGFTDGRAFSGPGDVNVIITAGTAPLTRNAAGDISFNLAISSTISFLINVTQQVVRRTGFGEDLQEQFGGAGISASAQPQFYRPDVIPGMATAQQLQPRTALKVKGFKLLSFDVIYSVISATLTSINVRVDQTIIQNAVGVASTVVLANGANGLSTAASGTPFVTNVALAAAQQVYRTSVDQSLWIEFALSTPGTGTARFYGVDLLLEYNYN